MTIFIASMTSYNNIAYIHYFFSHPYPTESIPGTTLLTSGMAADCSQMYSTERQKQGWNILGGDNNS